jgi:pyridoxal phosphate enzyme (YggS family)
VPKKEESISYHSLCCHAIATLHLLHTKWLVIIRRMSDQVQHNRQAILSAIAGAEREAGRVPGSARLVAVSKKQPEDRIDAALSCGHRLFGENRVQEAMQRWTARKEQIDDITLHMIGPLQTNKARDAVRLFDCIESVDRPRLARALGEEMKKQARNLPCFIQVNTGHESAKSGIAPNELPDFLALCRGECGLNIRGLMCIPPQDAPPGLHFALLAKLAARHNLPDLSMGMSGDFEKAVRLGATYVRLGTAFFGSRPSA